MKTYKYILLFFLSIITFNSCDYLDIVPDEKATEEDAFKNTKAAERYLYSCYGYLPKPNHGTSSLDLFTGDEVVTAFEHETFAHFPKGNYTASNPQISYWNTLFQGIKQCYILINNIDKVPTLPETTKVDYIGQANFLIAYYHFLLLRSYGPIILVTEEPQLDTPPENYLPRTNYDDCVEWISQKFDECIPDLPVKRDGQKYGLATSTAAKAIKARMLLYAASPLFNGNSEFYSDFTDQDGNSLMSTTFERSKWEAAKVATKEAIDFAEQNGFRLYQTEDAQFADLPEPQDPTQRALRFTMLDKTSKEVIWADTRHEGNYALQNKSRPFWAGSVWNGVAPTLTMLDRFYTENGLPIEEDPNYNYEGRFGITNFVEEDNLVRGEGKTQLMNVSREPRYYAWVSFHGGYYECKGEAQPTTENTQVNNPYLPKYHRGIDGNKVITFFTKNDNCGKHDRNNNYSPTGFLNKKGVHPASTTNGSLSAPHNYPWPVIRLGELYLNYAEACVETGDLGTAKVYLNKIRERAGIPTVEESWAIAGVNLDENKLRDVVRQERMIELYLENHNFWDMRRWKLAEQYFDVKVKGMNVSATSYENFVNPIELDIARNFTTPKNYLMPIPYNEINNNTNLVQNPGY